MTNINKLNLGYIFALSLVAIISISCYFIVHQALKQQETDASLINISGRQRLLSQRFVKSLMFLYLKPTPTQEENTLYIKQYQETVKEINVSLQDLKNGNSKRDLPALKDNYLYHQAILNLEKHLFVMNNRGKEVLDAFALEKYPDKNTVQTLIKSSESFLFEMNMLTNQLAKDSKSRVIYLERLEFVLLTVLLIVLFFEAILVFFPLVQQVAKDQKTIQDKNNFLKNVNHMITEYNYKLKSTQEEVQTQAEELKTQSEELQESNIKLEKLNQELDQVVQKRTQEIFDKNKTLQETNYELQTRNHELDSIIYRISHDLRSPLATMLGLFNIMKDIPDNQDLLILAESEGNRMDRFIHNINRFAESSRQKADVEQVDMEELIKDCFHKLRNVPGAQQMNHQIILQGDTQNVFTDESRLKMVFNNLITNAIHFQNPNIETQNCIITLQVDSKLIQITFWDNGLGIDETCMDKVFDMFYRGSERSKGSGIGLYIVKNAIEKLKGKISIKSSLGEFTQFNITIPNHFDSKTLQNTDNEKIKLLKMVQNVS